MLKSVELHSDPTKITPQIGVILNLWCQVTNLLTLISASYPTSPVSTLCIVETWLRFALEHARKEVCVLNEKHILT